MRVEGASPTGAHSPRVPGRLTLGGHESLVTAGHLSCELHRQGTRTHPAGGCVRWTFVPLTGVRSSSPGRTLQVSPGSVVACAQPPGLARSFLGRAGGHGDALPPLRGPRAPGVPSHTGPGHSASPSRSAAWVPERRAHAHTARSRFNGEAQKSTPVLRPPTCVGHVWAVILGFCRFSLLLSSKDD